MSNELYIQEIINDSRFNKEASQISLFDTLKYILGGADRGATITVFSIKLGEKYVYQIKQCFEYAKEDKFKNHPIKINRYFVYLLTGPNNEEDFTYIGTIDTNESKTNILSLRTTTKSHITEKAPAFTLFKYLLNELQCEPKYIVNLMNRVKVYHDGHCSICGRKLTDIISSNISMGPICAPELHKAYKLECKRRGIILPKK